MKVLFATSNPAKVKLYKERLQEEQIELITLKDLKIDIQVDENGKNAIENAKIKAKTYYDQTKIITIGMDNCLFIEGIDEKDQPGTHVRRVNGKELSDDEMIEYYINLTKKYGGKLAAKWVYGLVIYDGIEFKEYSWSRDSFFFVDKPCEKRNIGYPLDSITVTIDSNKYLAELTGQAKDEEKVKKQKEEVVNFLLKTLKEIERLKNKKK